MTQLQSFEQFIIGQALAEYNGKNYKELVEKVEGTAVGINPKAMRVFKELLEKKHKARFRNLKWEGVK